MTTHVRINPIISTALTVLILATLLSSATAVLAKPVMDQGKMESIVKSIATESKGEKGYVEFTYNQVKMYMISDTTHDRMRIISPVANYSDLTSDHLKAVLESNFHNALDARYAVSKEVLYAAFIHPLSTLSDRDLQSAMTQVANLAITFGSEYTSGVLNYGAQR